MDLHQENPDESCRHERSVEAGMSLDINTKQARKRMASIDDANRPNDQNTYRTAMVNGKALHQKVIDEAGLAVPAIN